MIVNRMVSYPLLQQLLFTLLCCCIGILVSAGCEADEAQALLDFKNGLGDAAASVLISWTNISSCCNSSWLGIACGTRHTYKVEGINLAGSKLKGSLTSVGSIFTRLKGLRELNLSQSSLSGEFPSELINLTQLERIDLSGNSLSGYLPGAFSSQLVHLNLSDNDFNGGFTSFQGVSTLQELDLSGNNLTGGISADICSTSPKLRVLDLSKNQLSGSLGSGLSRCENLTVIDVSSNRLNGQVPTDIGSLINLELLILTDNQFSGYIPEEIGKLQRLKQIWLSTNNLNGTIPNNLYNCSLLEILSLRTNALGGQIWIDCEKLRNLRTLDLSYNNLSGTIPSNLSKCSVLSTLALSGNNLTGEIPSELGEMKNLTTLSLSGNKLVGNIPHSLQNCSNLVSLVVSKNPFTKQLPEDITGFQSLQLFAIGNSNITGNVPQWLKNCSKLQVLDLSWNHLTGPLPDWLSELNHLFYLDLSNNSFYGELPPSFSRFPTLMTKDKNLTGLQTISSIYLVKYRYNMTALQYHEVLSFPPSLYLSHNNLTGEIPSSLANLQMLQCLSLNNNSLIGSIPDSLSKLTLLETLDLSCNQLNGSIPDSLSTLTFLSSFNVSYNQLTGPVPTQKQFATFSNSSYLGNKGLCGGPLEPCKIESKNNTAQENCSRHKRKILAISFSAAVGFLLVLTVMVIIMWVHLKQKAVHHQDDEVMKDYGLSCRFPEALNVAVDVFSKDLKDLTIAELLKATGDFDQANIIGCGGFGLVFKGTLPDGTKVAIKRLIGTSDYLQVEREFEAEVQILGQANHPNLVALLGHCKYGHDRLLIYSFMENGSLDYWLHERNDEGQKLDWPMRLKIARGAARGLAYLHEICNPHIVHRDIKSSNILLDDKFDAHVGDFGLARLMISTETHVTTELVGTLGYIPPEYGQAWVATLRGDVYSFGVVILELLTRRRPVDMCRPKESSDVVAWVRKMRAENKSIELLDPLLLVDGHRDEMLQVLEIACLCINPDPRKRPSIQHVVSWLEEVGADGTLSKKFNLQN